MPKINRPDSRSLLLGFLLVIVAITFSSSWLGRGCVIRSHTGILCPGCGGTRAARHLLKGQWVEVAKENLLIYLVLAAVLLQIGVIIARLKRGLPLRGPLQLTRREMVILLILISLFTVVRNIPVFPLPGP